ncbi:MAG: tetratricopeptide repeat protein [Chloroflexota bacterium]
MTAQLHIQLLGDVRLSYNGTPITTIDRPRMQALLAYLLLHRETPSPRQQLAFQFWPDSTEKQARTNLRNLYYRVRQAFPDIDAFVEADTTRLQWRLNAPFTFDVTLFEQAVAEAMKPSVLTPTLIQAIDLYQGPLLPNCYDDWLIPHRERLRRQATNLLDRLTTLLEKQADYAAAIPYAQQQVALEPWQEPAHRQLMRLLALDGRRSEALAQYERCRKALLSELDVTPDEETRALYEQIKQNKLKDYQLTETNKPSQHSQITDQELTVVSLPKFLQQATPPHGEAQAFVAREPELAQLHHSLEQVVGGQGQVVFVTGEAGQGKTRLVETFAKQAQTDHARLIVVKGSCNAYIGLGDPYLPFREILNLLVGDLEASWAAGLISQGQAQQLWDFTSEALQSLMTHGPDLLNTLVSTAAILKRSGSINQAYQTELSQLLSSSPIIPEHSHLSQLNIFQQYTQLMIGLAQKRPLLLILDDLQWADDGSINLLFHLGRWLKTSQILLVGIYRPTDVALGRRTTRPQDQITERHPLEMVVHEFQREFGEILIDLNRATGQPLVEALLDSEPNHLSPQFREALAHHTQGNPLFTVEIVRDLQDQGHLIRDERGYWVENSVIEWRHLPIKVEGIIGERLQRLPPTLYEILKVACVMGGEFIAEIVAQVLKMDEREVLRLLNGVLDKQHHLVRSQGSQRLGARRISYYRFHHILFQYYLYNTIDATERPYLHEDVGHRLEYYYAGQTEQVAVQLAHHFGEAGELTKALHYSLPAARQAQSAYANETALERYQQTLDMLDALGEAAPPALQAERPLIYQAMGQIFTVVGRLDEALDSYATAWALWEAIPDTAQQLAHICWLTAEVCKRNSTYEKGIEWIKKGLGYLNDEEIILERALLYQLGAVLLVRIDDLEGAIDWSQKGLAVASHLNTYDGTLALAKTYNNLGIVFYRRGEFEQAREHFIKALTSCQQVNNLPEQADFYINLGIIHQELGYWQQAREFCEQGRSIARKIGDPWKEAIFVANIGLFNAQAGAWDEALFQTEEALKMWEQLGGSQWQEANCLSNLAYIQIRRENWEAAKQTLKQSRAMFTEIKSNEVIPELERHWADLYVRTNDLDQALIHVNRSIELATELKNSRGEGISRCLLGQIYQAYGDNEQAEHEFRQSLQILNEVQSKYYSAKSQFALANHLINCGDQEEGEQYLQPALETFQTLGAQADLAEAHTLKLLT